MQEEGLEIHNAHKVSKEVQLVNVSKDNKYSKTVLKMCSHYRQFIPKICRDSQGQQTVVRWPKGDRPCSRFALKITSQCSQLR